MLTVQYNRNDSRRSRRDRQPRRSRSRSPRQSNPQRFNDDWDDADDLRSDRNDDVPHGRRSRSHRQLLAPDPAAAAAIAAAAAAADLAVPPAVSPPDAMIDIVQRHIAEVRRLRRQARFDFSLTAHAEATHTEDAPRDAAPAESALPGNSSTSAINVDDSPAVTIQSQVDAWNQATSVHLSDAGTESRILPVSPAEFDYVARATRDADELAHRLAAEQAEQIVACHEFDTHRLEAQAAEDEVARLELVASRADLEAGGFHCVVCFVANDLQVLACGHEFCRNCIRRFAKPICPLCRRSL